MCHCTRRTALAGINAALAALATAALAQPIDTQREFIAAAFAMKEVAVRSGDQPYGAVVVQKDRIVGYGPSRVVTRKDSAAHAEREAIHDAQARLARADLSDCVMYSTSRPCAACERAAADAALARMFYGPQATDAGPPRRG
jgi:tRNA(Arg) A34 adenosine deaminase TadA